MDDRRIRRLKMMAEKKAAPDCLGVCFAFLAIGEKNLRCLVERDDQVQRADRPQPIGLLSAHAEQCL
ncbi:hypothetical protein SLA2020_458290 [Shorea laevis]